MERATVDEEGSPASTPHYYSGRQTRRAIGDRPSRPYGRWSRRAASRRIVVGPLHLGVGVFVVCRADYEARLGDPMLFLDEGPEHVARELGVVVHHEYVGIDSGMPSPGRRPRTRMIAAAFVAVQVAVTVSRQLVDVVLVHVEHRRRHRQASDDDERSCLARST